MSRIGGSILAMALCSCWGAAFAQGLRSQPTHPDVGFFRPQAGDEASLVRTLPSEVYGEAQRTAVPPAAPSVTYVPVPVATTPIPEAQLDRAEAQGARANAQLAAQPHINGAFTGSTDPRDR